MSVCNTEHLALLVHLICLPTTRSVWGVSVYRSLRALSASLSILQAVCQPGAPKMPSHLGSAVHEYSSHRSPLLLLSTRNPKVNTERMTPNVRKHCLFLPIFLDIHHAGISWLARYKNSFAQSVFLSCSPVKISKCLSNKMILHLIDIKSCFQKMYLELSLLFVCDWWIVCSCFSLWKFMTQCTKYVNHSQINLLLAKHSIGLV